MKHLLNSILASSLILSMGTISFATELAETTSNTEVLQEIETNTLSSMSPEVASAYAEVIENITQKYGVNPSKELEVAQTGLTTAQLIDLDGDGIEELHLTYVKEAEHDYPFYTVLMEEVWKANGSTVTKVMSESFSCGASNGRSAGGTCFLPHNGKILIVNYWYYYGTHPYGNATVYELSNGTMTQKETIEINVFHHETCNITWTINGVESEEKLDFDFLFDNGYNDDMRKSLEKSVEGYNLSKMIDVCYHDDFQFYWNYSDLLPQLQAIASQPSSKTATPSTAKVMVNGELVNFGAYNIDGFNFYKLTDVSYALNGTGKQFEVTWDGEIGAINMKIGSPHIVLGSELEGTSGTDKIAEEMDVKVLKNSALVSDLIVYSINGSSYFQLDKLKGVLGIDVGWDGATSTITITT